MNATFAAGCFWGVQYYFDQVPEITSTKVGYTGGHMPDPTYEDIISHGTGHAEAVEIEFDPVKIDYEMLVRHFFRMHDPTQLNRQGPDVGDNYRSGIFYHNDDQKMIAEKVRDELASTFDQPIVTEITEVTEFYDAEDYHQKFTEKTGRGMCHVDYAPIER